MLDDLLATLEKRDSVTPVTPCYPQGVTAKLAPIKAVTPVTQKIINDVVDVCTDRPKATSDSSHNGTLSSYRAIAAEQGLVLDHDDRRHCDQCANLRRGVCTIAEPKAGALVVANCGYRPVREPPRRCAGYAPGQDDPDNRPGRERWPGLIQKGGE